MKKQIIEFITKSQFPALFSFVRRNALDNDDFTLIEARYNRLMRQQLMGTLSRDEFLREMARITSSLIEWANSLKEDFPKEEENFHPSHPSKFNWRSVIDQIEESYKEYHKHPELGSTINALYARAQGYQTRKLSDPFYDRRGEEARVMQNEVDSFIEDIYKYREKVINERIKRIKAKTSSFNKGDVLDACKDAYLLFKKEGRGTTAITALRGEVREYGDDPEILNEFVEELFRMLEAAFA